MLHFAIDSDRALPLLAASLAHFLWQGMLLAGALQVALTLMRGARAGVRYSAALAILAAMAVCPVATFCLISHSDCCSTSESVSKVFTYQQVVLLPQTSVASTTRDVTKAAAASTAGVWWRGLLRANAAHIVFVWLMGVTLLALRGMAGLLNLRRTLGRFDGQEVGAELKARLVSLARVFGVKRTPRLLVVTSAGSPFVFGLIGSTIVVPVGALVGLTPDMLDSILSHELCHARRHDYLINLLQCAIETVLFYHPAVWWVSGKIRAERETCCDELVVRTLNNPLEYARAIERLETMRAVPFAVAATNGSLRSRVIHILNMGGKIVDIESCSRIRGQLAAGLCTLFAAVGLFAAIGASTAQHQVSDGSWGSGVTAISQTRHGSPGTIITLRDSLQKPASGHPAHEGVVLDSDLKELVRELWAANAGTVQIGDQVVDREPRIRAWGNNINVNGFSMGHPFVVHALGDPDALKTAVEAGSGVLAHLRAIDPSIVSVEFSDHVELQKPYTDEPKSAFIVEMKIIKCSVSSNGSVVETIVASPKASTFGGVPASFSTVTTDRSGQTLKTETLRVDLTPGQNGRAAITVSYSRLENGVTSTATTRPGLTVPFGTSARVLGVVQTNDAALKSAVQAGRVIRDRGAYTAYCVDVTVD